MANIDIAAKNPGDQHTSAEFNKQISWANAPSKSLGAFNGAMDFGSQGQYDDFTMTGPLALTASNIALFNVQAVRITTDGINDITFGTGIDKVITAFVNPLPVGDYWFYMASFVSPGGGGNGIHVNIPEIQPVTPTFPVVLSMTVEDAAPNDLIVTFDSVVTGTNIGYSFNVNAAPRNLTGLAGSGTDTWTFTFDGAAVVFGDTLTASYDKSAGDSKNSLLFDLQSFTDQPVVNNVPSSYLYSEAIAADTSLGDMHISALNRINWTLDGNDITQATSLPNTGGASATIQGGGSGVLASVQKPSLDAVNNWIHFDKANTEGLTNQSTFPSNQAGDDLPFSFAMVVRFNTVDSSFYTTWSFGADSDIKPYINAGIQNTNDLSITKRDQEGTANTDGPTTIVSLNTNWHIITGFCSGTALTVYYDGTKVADAASFDVETVSNINQFALGLLARNAPASFIDMDLKEFAFLNSNVGDARVQAWNTDLNNYYSIY